MNNDKRNVINRILIEVSLLEPFRDLKIKWYPESEAQTLEQFLSCYKGCYLIDPTEDGFFPLEKAIEKNASKIFYQELKEIGIPKDMWPDINDNDVFNKYIKVEAKALMADLGTKPIKSIEVDI